MMHTLDIEHGAEVGLNHDMANAQIGSFMCFEFKVYNEHVPRLFILPEDFDYFASFLLQYSLSTTIEHAFRHWDVCKGQHYLHGYQFYLVESKDGNTNITPEFISTISKFYDRLK